MPAPHGNLFEEMHASVLAATQDLDGIVTIDMAAVEKLAAGAEADRVDKAELPLRGLPLRFENLEAEVNFFALLHCLDFGSGWSAILEQRTGRPFDEILLFGLIGLHLEGNKLDAEALSQITPFNLGVLLQIPISQEVEVAPAIRQDRDSEEKPLIMMFHRTLQEVARKLQERGFSSLGQLVLSSSSNGFTSEERRNDGEGSAGGGGGGEGRLRQLVETVEAFRDVGEVDGVGPPLQFHRKAVLLLLRLHSLHHADEPSLNFPDLLASAPVGAELGTLALLQQQGLLRLDNALRHSPSPLSASRFPEPLLRAAACRTCSAFAASLSSRLGAPVPPWKAMAYLYELASSSPDGGGDRQAGSPREGLVCRDTFHY